MMCAAVSSSPCSAAPVTPFIPPVWLVLFLQHMFVLQCKDSIVQGAHCTRIAGMHSVTQDSRYVLLCMLLVFSISFFKQIQFSHSLEHGSITQCSSLTMVFLVVCVICCVFTNCFLTKMLWNFVKLCTKINKQNIKKFSLFVKIIYCFYKCSGLLRLQGVALIGYLV